MCVLQAYSNKRMDLTEVEGLGDLINADTEAQRKQALSAMGGFKRKKLDAWREAMIKALAYALKNNNSNRVNAIYVCIGLTHTHEWR